MVRKHRKRHICMKKEITMTEGSIVKQILGFFFPILIGVFFQQLYNTVDAAIVGQFAGKKALAGVGGSSGQILNFLFSFFMGLSSGATVIIAQHYGAREEKKVDVAWQVLNNWERFEDYVWSLKQKRRKATDKSAGENDG